MAIIEGNYVHFGEHGESLLSQLYELYRFNMFLDVSINFQGEEIYAHRAVLAAASPIFRNRLHTFIECQSILDIENELQDIHVVADDIKRLVEFIYKGHVCIPQPRLSLFIEIGNRFQIVGLYNSMNDNNSNNINSDNNDNNCTYQPLLNMPPPLSPQSLQQYNFSSIAPENLDCGDFPSFETDLYSNPFPVIGSDISFPAPVKISDSAMKFDKLDKTAINMSVVNNEDVGVCPIENGADPLYILQERDYAAELTDECNPKVLCEQYLIDNDSINNLSNSLDSDTLMGVQMQITNEKDIFGDQSCLSPANGDPDILFTNLSNQPNSFFTPGGLDLSNSTEAMDQNDFSEFQFPGIKMPFAFISPDRQIRLKVKDSIGGVSLQDTSQGDLDDLKELAEEKKSESKALAYSVDLQQIDSSNILEIDINNEIQTINISELDNDIAHKIISHECTYSQDLENENEHTCNQCNEMLNSLGELTTHLWEKHGIGTIHNCFFCEFTTPIENCLVEHGIENHLKVTDHQCCICRKTYKNKKNLRIHILSHNPEKDYRCTQCTAHYSQRYNLVKHLASEHKLDANSKPILKELKCPDCDFKTYGYHTLQGHRIRCHIKTKSFNCDICPYSTTESSSLIKHMRIHTQEQPYVCDVCGRRFKTVSLLSRHSRTHTKEKPYTCEECGHGYADKKRLRDHYFKHKNMKPFQCNSCTYSCRRKDNLLSHIRRNHPNEKEIYQSIDELIQIS